MKLSIITITYNNRDGLQRTIDSVISQTSHNFEWILIDGNSIDGSKELIENLDNNPNANIAYWCSECDSGVYDAMNKGIREASCDYCIFLNSGDCFYSNDVIERALPLLDGTDLIYGNTHYVNGEIRLSRNEPDLFSFLYKSCYCHQSMFIKTRLLKEYLYDSSLKIVADWKFYLQTMILSHATFKAIDINISLYDSTGISSTNKELYETEREEVLNQLFPHRMLEDYQNLVYGKTLEDKLYVEIKHSVLHKLMYSLNVLLIRTFTLLSRGSLWAKKYPIRYTNE